MTKKRKPEAPRAAAPVGSIDQANFRLLAPNEQMLRLRGERFERVFQVDRENGIDTEKRTAWLSIASEEPYERWWGIEILDVRTDSIRDARLRMGAPLLVGHDTADQVGVVEDYEITPERKLRILARFGKSARAEEIWQDVLDGIRRNTSVGYVIHDLVLERQEEGVNTYRVTDWEPLEGSLVPVPADPTVGVGRAIEAEAPAPEPQTPKERTMDKTTEELNTQAIAADAVKREQKRVADLMAAGEQYKAQGGIDVAAALVKDPNGSIDQFRAQMLEKVATKTAPTQTAAPAERPAGYGQGARNIIYSGKIRGFKPVEFADGTRISAEEAAYRAGMWALAVIYQRQTAARWCRDMGLSGHLEVRDLNEGVGSTGGYLVPVELESAVIDLRVQYGVARRLARYVPMGSGSLERPRRTGGITAYFVGDTAGATASDKSWDKVRLNAKLLNALSKLSTSVVEDAVIDLAMDVADEQAYAFATKEDQCMFVGDGTSTYGGMQGINTIFEANTTYAGFVKGASGHDTWIEMDNSDTTAALGKCPTFGRVGARWVISPFGDARIFGRLKATAGGNTATVLRDGVIETDYLGYPVTLAEAMPAGTDATDYSNKVMALFGNFSKSTTFGERRGITVQILRELYAANNEIGVMSTERIDIVNHDLGSTTAAGPVVALAGE